MIKVTKGGNNMLFYCVTVGLVLLASKYRDNVLRGVKTICDSIKSTTVVAHQSKCKRLKTRKQREYNFPLDKIILADSPEKCDYAVKRIRCDMSNGVLGFDCEWVNEGPISLIQLATNNGVCALFRLGKIGYVPELLKDLLANRRVLKVGVASLEDGQKLNRDYGCGVFGTVDLRTLALRLGLPYTKSLAALSLQYLGVELEKIIEVRCGDWNADTLADEQIKYAAIDAIASVYVYHEIKERAKQRRTLWQTIYIFFKSIWEKDEIKKYHDLPNDVIDTRFKAPSEPMTIVHKDTTNYSPVKIEREIEKINSGLKKSSIPARNKPLYHNCYLQAPDGDILCTCDRKKAEWYLAKQLGVIVDEDPLTVRLKFEPSGRALGEVGQYYTQVKVNRCVVCGASDRFIRKNVVPREYRKYFPLIMKAHQSHDVLLLCPKCHEISNLHDLELRKTLADMCSAPLAGPINHSRDIQQQQWRKIQSALKALKEKAKLPPKRQQELEKCIMEITGQRECTPKLIELLCEQLSAAKSLSPSRQPNQSKAQPHGVKVVKYFESQNDGLVELEKMWREHFISTMKPQYLPSLWSVSHNRDRLSICQTQKRIDEQDAHLAGICNLSMNAHK